MHIYLIGPKGPEQVATKWLLEQRGYRVKCATEVASPDYQYNNGARATPTEFRRLQMLAMVDADMVVLADGMKDAAALEVLRVARFAGLRVCLHQDLPAQCPSVVREMEIMDELDLLQADADAEPVDQWLVRHAAAMYKRVRRNMRRFDRRYGWFFTNGNKQHRVAQYAEPRTTLSTTA